MADTNLPQGAQPELDTLSLAYVEKVHILKVYGDCDKHQKRAAEILGITARTLRKKLKVYRREESDAA